MKERSRIFCRNFSLAVLAVFLFIAALPAAAEPTLLSKMELMKQVPDDPGKVKLASFLEKGLHSYENLNDYKTLFEKKETKDGKLGEFEKIYLKFEKPFKIYMGWLNSPKKGLQVVYERGKHDGKLAIHQPGLFLGLAQVIFLNQNSPWIREGSASYNIEDAGIGTFLNDFSKAVVKAHEENHLKVDFREDQTAEVIFDSPVKDPVYFAHRIVVKFDKESGLPLYQELYDWEDKLIGIYSYENFQTNTGSEDPEFRKEINRRLYRVYAGSDNSEKKDRSRR